MWDASKEGPGTSPAAAARVCVTWLHGLLHSPVRSWVGFLCVLVHITETGTTNFPLELCPVPLTQRFSTGGDFVPQDT